MKRIPFIGLCLLLGAVNLAAIARAQDSAPQNCRDCHDGPVSARGVVPPGAALVDSIHHDLDCTDCHASISMDGRGGPRVPEAARGNREGRPL